MKKLTLCLFMLFGMLISVSAQDIYNEVVRMQKDFKTIKEDKSKKLEERQVASFKWDAIEYMLYKGREDSTFTERQLGEQTYAMTEFVSLFFKRLGESNKSKNREIAYVRFQNASLNNSLFHDMDKDLVLAYINKGKYPTPFSLDTDWVKALAEIRSKSWN